MQEGSKVVVNIYIGVVNQAAQAKTASPPRDYMYSISWVSIKPLSCKLDHSVPELAEDENMRVNPYLTHCH